MNENIIKNMFTMKQKYFTTSIFTIKNSYFKYFYNKTEKNIFKEKKWKTHENSKMEYFGIVNLFYHYYSCYQSS